MIPDAAIDPSDGLIVDEVGRAYASSPPSHTANKFLRISSIN
jgi:hypothetical protein